jgi:tetratricopeptide (TPR) repeat protein
MRLFAIALAIGAFAFASTAPADAKPAKPAPKKPPPKTPPPKPEPPPSPEKIRADKLFEDGRKYLASKEYALACTAFEQSQQAEAAIGTQLNIALCYEEWGKFASAYHAYVEAERLAKSVNDPDHRDVGAHKKADDLKLKVSHLAFVIPADADPSTVFLLDGKETDRAALAGDILVDPGKHTIEARVPGKPPKQTAIDLGPADKRTITIDIPRPEMKVIVTQGPRKAGRLYGGIALVGGGAVAIGAATFLALVARQDYADALASCPNHVCETREAFDATQKARKRATYMTFVGAGGALMAAFGVYYILSSKGERIEQKVRVAPAFTPDGSGLALVVGGAL